MELLNAFFTSTFAAKASLQKSLILERRESLEKENFSIIKADQFRVHVGKCGGHKSMNPNRMCLQVLRKLADIIAMPLSNILERSGGTGEVPEDWRKANGIPVFKNGEKDNPGNYRPVSLTWKGDGKMMEQLILDVTYKHVEEKMKLIWNSQHEFTKGKSFLINLIASYARMTVSVVKDRAAGVVYLDCSKAFDTVSP
ncbi:RNA-directed DNA polymerase from mobile element jockey-like protein [Willisornis vidua]|uniref:RNA-directed DNA polymerase from mobile element jockey-like protein n=1 Tax=Willisornis vidua TaxID=1566151 RepID=A0ABQ9CLH4_9PASS|nr:RNA-directed DNA polymerase from mobile element jockey-like protein [Willisornis vidua]